MDDEIGPGSDPRPWFLKTAPLDELRMQLPDNSLVPLRDNQKEEIQKWRNGETYKKHWLQICDGSKNVLHNTAMFISRTNDILRVSWPTLGAGNFLEMYQECKESLGEDEFHDECAALVTHTLREEGVDNDDIQAYLDAWQAEGEATEEFMPGARISQKVQREWTSCTQLETRTNPDNKMNGCEFCSILNHAIRGREHDRIGLKHAVRVTRTMNNEFNVLARAKIGEISEGDHRSLGAAHVHCKPPELKTWRGGALPREHRDFFRSRAEATGEDKKYRVPMFLASSHNRGIAKTFMDKQPREQQVLWILHFPAGVPGFDLEGRAVITGCCVHVNLIGARMVTVGEEHEWLLPPFSAMSVRNFRENPDGSCEVELDVAPDGQAESDLLPLAPWH